MGSEDIINLDSSSDEGEIQPIDKENKTNENIIILSENNNINTNNNNNENGSPKMREEGEIQEGDDPSEQDMDLGNDVVVSKHSSAELATNGPSSSALNAHASMILVDQTPIRGVKRARVEYNNENEPSVRVIFNNLSRESKRKLMGLMQQWSQWEAKHGQSSSLSKDLKDAPLESGEEIYYPALHVGFENSSTVSFWVDNQARTDNLTNDTSVPLYDREFTLGSSSADGSTNFEKADKEEPRCFNCGSYSHAMKECSKPRDLAAINNARKVHYAKKNVSNTNQGQNRYYQRKPGKFDDLKPGVLSLETRECLGIGEFDPPPWLTRMREIGYPPGYLEIIEDEDKPSGITIFTDNPEEETQNQNTTKNQEYEDGELPVHHEPGPPKTRKTVDFPGINAPIPEKADPFLWSTADPVRAPPPIYSSRYDPYDSYNSNNGPSLSRSSSDRWSSRSDSHLYQYGSDLGMYKRERGWDRDRERERDRERDRERSDHRRHHHRR